MQILSSLETQITRWISAWEHCSTKASICESIPHAPTQSAELDTIATLATMQKSNTNVSSPINDATNNVASGAETSIVSDRSTATDKNVEDLPVQVPALG